MSLILYETPFRDLLKWHIYIKSIESKIKVSHLNKEKEKCEVCSKRIDFEAVFTEIEMNDE